MGSFTRALKLAQPYWCDARHWRSWLVLSTVIAMVLVLVVTAILATYWQRALFNSLETKDWSAFVALLFTWHTSAEGTFTIGFTPLLLVNVICTVYRLYLTQSLQIHWRSHMTGALQRQWMQERIYYRMQLQGNTEDNPDQRIAEDVSLFVDKFLTLGLGLLETSVSMVSFIVLLWGLSNEVTFFGQTISGSLVIVALLYAGIGTLVTHLIGKQLVGLNFTQQQVEADFRYQLVRVRDNAESIAFHRGEKQERHRLGELFEVLADNWRSIMKATKKVMLFSTGFSQATLVFPLVIAAPAYFAGSIPLGGVFQTANALNRVIENLSWFVENYLTLATFGATIDRLSRFCQEIDNTAVTSPRLHRVVDPADQLRCEQVSVQLPDGSSLVEPFNLQIEPGESVAITGASGTGKSSLLRTFAGLWPHASGTLALPAEPLVFVPQHPYVPAGTLLRVLYYPHHQTDIDQSSVSHVLEQVELSTLMSMSHQDKPWHHRLSGGETQRLNLARLLLARPKIIFLDESTSHLDANWAHRYYTLLKQTHPYCTLVSVAHSKEVIQLHDRQMSLKHHRLHC